MLIADKIKLRDNNFDFLRFLAATLVIFSHSFALTAMPYEPYVWLSGYASFGALAVNIFFILSGFLITKSWLDNPKILIFLKKRILRIMPGLFVAVVFTILVIGPLVTTLSFREYLFNPMTREYFNNALLSVSFFLPGVFADNLYKGAVNGSLWTLPIEFRLYMAVLALGIIRLLGKKSFILLAGVALFIFTVINTYQPTLYNFNSTELDYLRCSMYFLTGILFYLYSDKIKFSKYIFLVSLVALVASFKWKYGSEVSYLVLPYIVLYFGLFKIKSLEIFSKYGDFSYGLYIYAFPVQQTIIYFAKNNISVVALFFSAFIVTLLLAILSWKFVEKPCMKLRSVSFRSLPRSIVSKFIKVPVSIE